MEKDMKALKIIINILLWVYAIGGLLVLLSISLGKMPVGIDWVMICVCVLFFGNKIRNRWEKRRAAGFSSNQNPKE